MMYRVVLSAVGLGFDVLRTFSGVMLFCVRDVTCMIFRACNMDNYLVHKCYI